MQNDTNDKLVENYFQSIGYEILDPFKKMCQKAILRTLFNNKNIEIEKKSIGESCLVGWLPSNERQIQKGLALVVEGLGTKGIVAQRMYELTGEPYGFGVVAKDTFRMITNDMITSGALPIMANMYLAIGHKDWMLDIVRSEALVAGWEEACHEAGVVWMGGETPTLKGIIEPKYFDICGSATGFVERGNYLHGSNIVAGDRIIIINGWGIHANGLTDAREVGEQLPQGYLTKLSNGMSFGEALLQPTADYVPLMRHLLEEGIKLHYAVNITGHAWAKLMRAEENFKYVIEHILEPQELFSVIQKHKGYTIRQMHSYFNMNGGFAIYAPQRSVANILLFAEQLGLTAIDAGYIETADTKSVEIRPIDVTLTDLDIR